MKVKKSDATANDGMLSDSASFTMHHIYQLVLRQVNNTAVFAVPNKGALTRTGNLL